MWSTIFISTDYSRDFPKTCHVLLSHHFLVLIWLRTEKWRIVFSRSNRNLYYWQISVDVALYNKMSYSFQVHATYIPVSYTHLDVYKRQLPRSASMITILLSYVHSTPTVNAAYCTYTTVLDFQTYFWEHIIFESRGPL